MHSLSTGGFHWWDELNPLIYGFWKESNCTFVNTSVIMSEIDNGNNLRHSMGVGNIWITR